MGWGTEIITILQIASQNILISVVECLAIYYQQQFPDSAVAMSVAISPNKMSYVVVYGLRPYFTDITIREVMEGQSYFILHFNETVNAQV